MIVIVAVAALLVGFVAGAVVGVWVADGDVDTDGWKDQIT